MKREGSWSADKVEGLHDIGIAFTTEGKTGTVTIKVNGEIVAEGIKPTYILGETQKFHFIKYVAPETGKYTVTSGYIAGEDDCCFFTNPVMSASLDAIVRTERKLTVEGGTAEGAPYYAGDRVTVNFTGNTDSFDRWEMKNSEGKLLSAANHPINDKRRRTKSFSVFYRMALTLLLTNV